MTLKNRVFSRLFDKEKYEVHAKEVEKKNNKKLELAAIDDVEEALLEATTFYSKLEELYARIDEDGTRLSADISNILDERDSFMRDYEEFTYLESETSSINSQIIQPALDKFETLADELGIDPYQNNTWSELIEMQTNIEEYEFGADVYERFQFTYDVLQNIRN